MWVGQWVLGSCHHLPHLVVCILFQAHRHNSSIIVAFHRRSEIACSAHPYPHSFSFTDSSRFHLFSSLRLRLSCVPTVQVWAEQMFLVLKFIISGLLIAFFFLRGKGDLEWRRKILVRRDHYSGTPGGRLNKVWCLTETVLSNEGSRPPTKPSNPVFFF